VKEAESLLVGLLAWARKSVWVLRERDATRAPRRNSGERETVVAWVERGVMGVEEVRAEPEPVRAEPELRRGVRT
jgi:hypothetical protein